MGTLFNGKGLVVELNCLGELTLQSHRQGSRPSVAH